MTMPLPRLTPEQFEAAPAEACAQVVEMLHLGREDGARLQRQANAHETSHEDRLLSGVCLPRSSSSYLAMLDGFREVERHTRRIADALEKPAARA